jgi:ankyrin repeat protein
MEQYPMHIAARIANPSDPTLVYHIYNLAPAIVTERDEDGLLPLHVACASISRIVMEILLQLNKTASGDCENYMQSFPLHVACRRDDCIRVLDAYPEAAKHANSDGDLPIQITLSIYDQYCNPLKTITLLVKAFPEGLKEKDEHYGDLPMHLATHSMNDCPEIVKLLLNNFPDAANITNSKGNLPVHVLVL